MLERGRKKFWVGFGECVIASLVVPVLLLLPGQLNYLHVFDRVLTDAERGTSQATPSQSRPPPRAVPRAPPRYPVCCATPSSPWTSSSPAGS